MLSAPSFRHLRYAPPASAPADIASLHFCYNALQCSKATESCGTKNARDRVGGVQMTNCFVHMIEFEQTIEFCALLCSHTHTYIVQQHTWLEEAGEEDYPGTLQTQRPIQLTGSRVSPDPRFQCFDPQHSIQPKLWLLHRGEVKQWGESSNIQFLAR